MGASAALSTRQARRCEPLRAVSRCWERDSPQRCGLNTQKSSIFAHRRSPRGRFERRLTVGSRLARLGATTCALQRPSGANSEPPPRCGRLEVRRGARDGMVVSTECVHAKVSQNGGVYLWVHIKSKKTAERDHHIQHFPPENPTKFRNTAASISSTHPLFCAVLTYSTLNLPLLNAARTNI